MGTYVIKMPDIGEGIAEVEVAAWYVRPGDLIAEDQVIADVMTDKATVEIPSPVAGKVLALGGEAGKVFPVGGALIHIEVEGAGNTPDVHRGASADTSAAGRALLAAPPAAGLASADAEDPVKSVQISAPDAQKRQRRAGPHPLPDATPRIPSPGCRPLASPSVRKRAWDQGIALNFVAASGSIGQVTHRDLDAFESGQRNTIASPGRRTSTRTARTDQVEVPVIGLRRRIAERMQESKRHIPHFTYVQELDVTELEALRAHLNATWGSSRGRLTPLPFIARAVIRALEAFPQVNARYDDAAGVVTRFGAVHLGVAAQTLNGLVVPVVRHAETLDLWETGAEITRLAAAARNGKATREELSGSTITITSLGALGGIVSTPVINRPEVAIVGVNRMVERPMIHRGAIVPRLMMNLSSSFDHRVVDGMDAAEFIHAVQALLEVPATLFLEQA